MSQQYPFKLKFNKIDTFSKKYSHYLAFFRFCGFFTVYPNTTFNTCLKNTFRISYFLLVIMSLLSFILYIQTIKMDGRSLSTMTLKSLFLVNLITTLTSFIQSDVCKGASKNLLNKLDEIDRLFQTKLYVKIDFQKELKQTRKTIALALWMFLIVSIIVLAQAYATPKSYTTIVLRKIAGFLIFIRCMQFLFFIKILHFRLMLVNETIKDLLSEVINKPKPDYTIIQYISEASKKSYPKILVYEKLIILKRIHDSLWQCCQYVNNSFGWSLLIIVSAFFIDFTLYGYFLILFFLRGNATITYGEIFGNACPKLIALLLICYAIDSSEKSVSIFYMFRLTMKKIIL